MDGAGISTSPTVQQPHSQGDTNGSSPRWRATASAYRRRRPGNQRGALQFPTGVAVDAAGNLYIADKLNSRVRKCEPAGTITTVAGNGSLFRRRRCGHQRATPAS